MILFNSYQFTCLTEKCDFKRKSKRNSLRVSNTAAARQSSAQVASIFSDHDVDASIAGDFSGQTSRRRLQRNGRESQHTVERPLGVP